MSDTEELATRVTLGILERTAAARELRELGINPSPADTEAWLRMTGRQRDSAAVSWAVYQGSGLFGNPGNPD